MHQSKPFLILQTLEAAEWKRFGEFLGTPLFNKSDSLRLLFDWIARFKDRSEAKELDRTAVYAHLFPAEPYDDKKFRYLLSDLSKALEEFLSWSAFQEDTFLRDKLLLRSYQQRKLDKYYHHLLSGMEKKLGQHPYRDASYQNMRFQLEEARFQFNSSRKSHQTETNLQQVVDTLDLYFLANKLRYSCEILNNRGVVNVEYELFLLDEIQHDLQKRNLEQYPVIAIYYQILRTLREPSETAHYYRLLELLEQHRHLFRQNEVFDMYVYAKNYCIIKINKGDVSFTRELFAFYQIMLDAGILLRDGKMTQWDFKNLVSLGLRLEEFDWVKQFMAKHRDSLDPAQRDNVWRFNQANLHFHLGEYAQTLSLLQEVEFTDAYYHLDAKTLLLKTYYETGEWDSLQSLIEAFKVYLKRNRFISTYQQTVYGNLVRFVHALVRYRIGKKVSLEELSEEVERCREIANIIWLRRTLEKAQEGRS